MKITLALMLYLTWDGLDRMRPPCVSVPAAASFHFGVITDLTAVCIIFGVAPVRHVWKGVSSVRSEDKLVLSSFGVAPARHVMEKGPVSFPNDALT